MKLQNGFFISIALMQCYALFSYEFSCDENNNSQPRVEMHVNQNAQSSRNWDFSANVITIPGYSAAQIPMHCSPLLYKASPQLQHYFSHVVTPLMYYSAIAEHYCALPGYIFSHGLRQCLYDLPQFISLDAPLIPRFTDRLETYCVRIETVLFNGANNNFCESLSRKDQITLIHAYANFLKEFYPGSAQRLYDDQAQHNPLMQQVKSEINWNYYDGCNAESSVREKELRSAASVQSNLGTVYKALHEGDIEKACTVGNEVVRTAVSRRLIGKKVDSTSVFERYPALQQKVASYSVKATKDKQEKEAQKRAVIVQAECTNHVLQKSHFDTVQQRYDAATRTILNSQSVKTIHKVNALQTNYLDIDHLTSDRKGILFEGNHLQHHLVDEAITVVDAVISNDLTENMHDAVVDLTNASLSLNKNGDVVMASRTLDACWALIDFAKDAASYTYSALSTHVPLIAKGACDGVCESLHGAVHMVCHPVEAAQDVVNSFVVAGYYLGKLAYADCVLEAATDLLETDPKYCEQMIGQYAIDPQTLVAIYEYAQKNNVTEDVARVGTKAAIDTMLLHGVTKVVSAIAIESLPNFLSCMRKGGESVEVAMTTEGVPVRCAEEVACLMEQMEKAGIGIKGAAETFASSRDFVEGIVNNFMSEVKAEIEALKQIFDCGKACVSGCVKKGFAEFKNKHIKIPYEHIFGIELKWNQTKGTLSGISGFHHDFMGKVENSGVLKFVRKGVEENGCYMADIVLNDSTISGKTFFPQYWSREKVISKIYEAYEKFIVSGVIPLEKGGKYVAEGLTQEGIKIRMYITKNGQITTAYPIVK